MDSSDIVLGFWCLGVLVFNVIILIRRMEGIGWGVYWFREYGIASFRSLPFVYEFLVGVLLTCLFLLSVLYCFSFFRRGVHYATVRERALHGGMYHYYLSRYFHLVGNFENWDKNIMILLCFCQLWCDLENTHFVDLSDSYVWSLKFMSLSNNHE